jgi:SAM-dependent methyltransferase
MFGTRDEFDYVECGECGTVQIAQIPTDLGKYYPDNYFSFESAENTDLGATFGRRLGARFAGTHLLTGKSDIGKFVLTRKPWMADHFPPSLSEPLLDLSFNSRILDVGCGNGRLLQALHYFGFTNLRGADAFIEKDVAYSTGVNIYKRTLDQLDPSYDLIMLHHAFEHFVDPLDSFHHLNRLLEVGRFCLVRLPVVNYTWEKYGVDWVQLDAPRHLFLFSEKSLCQVAESAGFKTEKVVYDSGSFQFWASEQYLRDIPLTDPRSYQMDPANSMFSNEQIANWEAEAAKLNLAGRGDQAAFYFRKVK